VLKYKKRKGRINLENQSIKERGTPLNILDEVMIREEDDPTLFTQEITGKDGKKSITVGTETPIRLAMKVINSLSDKEIDEVIKTVKKSGVCKINKDFNTEYRTATKEDIETSRKDNEKELEEIKKYSPQE